ncbi:hypothetical protein KIW84_073541 [Lathyrus oleraceus]|uniref:Uncharacterized protein n=1 Tax=Pisum sativum TaxID=3888 RepID=A0A9D4VNX5_PEA|nr:hypothetical protein KIW84_073541 [Pisum sativum]
MFIHTQSTPNPESLMFHPDASWEFLKPEIFAAIMDFYSSGEPLFLYSQAAASKNTAIHDDDSETVAMIKELLETRIRPAVQDDGIENMLMYYVPEVKGVEQEMDAKDEEAELSGQVE